MSAAALFTIQQAALQLGIHPETLRRWESRGLIPLATRRNGYRVYTPADVERVRAAVFSVPEAPAERRRE